MCNKFIVTVVDKNIINQFALKLLIKSISINSPNQLYQLNVLYPRNEIPIDFLRWLQFLNIAFYSYDINSGDDPYRSKFLLAHFLNDCLREGDILCYMDPDHLIFDIIKIETDTNTLKISSEVKPLDDNISNFLDSSFLINNGLFKHYNTSIIIGHYETWMKFVNDWIPIYNIISPVAPLRYREEIAFTLAAIKANVTLSPVDYSFQSGFYGESSSCIAFHYGGDFRRARQIKTCLNDKYLAFTCLTTILEESNDPLQCFIINRILDFLKIRSI